MRSEARLVREEGEAVAALRDPTGAAADEHVAPLATALADYLESRRLAYSLLHWERLPTDLHGPLDAKVLLEARWAVLNRQRALADFLREAARRLGTAEKRSADIRELVERDRDDVPLVDAYVAELDALDRIRRRESERISHALFAFQHYREALVRMASSSALI